MKRKYKNSPIVEAACEFRLSSDSQWDSTIPGLFYKEIESKYPNKESRLVQEVTVANTPQGTQHQTRIRELTIFLTPDKKNSVQIGQHLVVINCLNPYPGWEIFKPRIQEAFVTLSRVVKIGVLESANLRYVNRIDIPGQSVDLELEEYFQFYPFLGKNLPQHVGSFMVGCVLPYRDGKDSCKLQLNSALSEEPSKGHSFLLDLHFWAENVTPEKVLEWTEEAHKSIEELFEGSITDKLREILHEVK